MVLGKVTQAVIILVPKPVSIADIQQENQIITVPKPGRGQTVQIHSIKEQYLVQLADIQLMNMLTISSAMANGQTTVTALAAEQKVAQRADTMEAKQKTIQTPMDNGNIILPKWILTTAIRNITKGTPLVQTAALPEWILSFTLSPSSAIGQVIATQDTKGQNIVRYVITR
jgi:hypothetical protein